MHKRPYLTVKRNRFRFRSQKGGRDWSRSLPFFPGHPEFEAAYARHLLALTEPLTSRVNSLEDIAGQYRESHFFRDLAPKTKRQYDRVLDLAIQIIGDAPMDEMTREIGYIILRHNEPSPSTQKERARVLSIIGNFAVDLDVIQINPWKALKTPKLPGVGFAPFTAEAAQALLEKAQGAVRRASWLGVYQAQRISDILDLK